MLPLKARILNYLYEWYTIDPNKYINGGEIERLAMEVGRKASNASRRLRELAEDGKIERHKNKKGHVEYRYKPTHPNLGV